jgi:hypothetical protein
MKRNEKNIAAAQAFIARTFAEQIGLPGSMLTAGNYIVGRPGGTVRSRDGKPTVDLSRDLCDNTLHVTVSDGYSVKEELKALGFRFDPGSTNWSRSVDTVAEAVEVIDALPGIVAGYDYPLDKSTEEIFAAVFTAVEAAPPAKKEDTYEFPADFDSRIEQGAAAAYVDLRGSERALYHGCGYHLAVIDGGRITALRRVGGDMPLDQEPADYIRETIAPWLGMHAGADVRIGMCSCYQFCDPSPIKLDAVGIAKIARRIALELAEA